MPLSRRQLLTGAISVGALAPLPHCISKPSSLASPDLPGWVVESLPSLPESQEELASLINTMAQCLNVSKSVDGPIGFIWSWMGMKPEDDRLYSFDKNAEVKWIMFKRA